MPFGLIIPCLEIFLEDIIRDVEKYSYSKMFTIAVLIIAKSETAKKIRNNLSIQQRGQRNYGKAIKWNIVQSFQMFLKNFNDTNMRNSNMK